MYSLKSRNPQDLIVGFIVISECKSILIVGFLWENVYEYNSTLSRSALPHKSKSKRVESRAMSSLCRSEAIIM